MNSKSGKKFSLDEMTAMHEIRPTEEAPILQISQEEWERLDIAIEDMEALLQRMNKERKDMFTTSQAHITRMEKLIKEASKTITENQKQVGSTSEKLILMVEKQEKKEKELWILHLLLSTLPPLLVLLFYHLLDFLL